MSRRTLVAALSAACLLFAAGSVGATTAQACELPAGAPPGVCPDVLGADPPLASSSTTATRLIGGRTFTEGPVWGADPRHLLMSDIAAATGSQRVQPSTILRFTPGSTAVETFVAD